jgi:glucosylceramidase
MATTVVTTTRQNLWQYMSPAGTAERQTNLRITDVAAQSWDGFGGCFNELGWLALSSLDEKARAKVLDALFHPEVGCRFNYCRLPIGASDYAAEWYSHNETPDDLEMAHFSIDRDRRILIPYIREALKRCPDLRLFASPWSPPTWLKFPRAYNYGTLIWKPEYLDAYARYFVRFVQAYRDEGITIHAVHVQNEPVADQKFPSCVWSGTQMRDFIRDHLGPAFEEAGLTTEIWLGTLNTDDYDGFPHTVLSDAAARRFVKGVGFQWAGKGAVQRTAQSWPDVAISQTENECGDGRNTWEYATYVHGLLRHYICNGVSSYCYWNMVLEPGGRSTWGWNQNSMVVVDPAAGEVTYTPEFHVMKHFSAFVNPGARLLRTEGPWTGNAVAFRNPDDTLVVALNNPFPCPRGVCIEAGTETVAYDMPPESLNTMVIS